MASGGSDISARISAEDQKIDYNALRKIAHKHFIQHKVDISDAIKKVFPFLEILRDRGFITDKIYEESRKSWEKSLPIEKVVYDVLEELEKTFNLPLLDTLFCRVIMKSYPELNCIREGFRYVIIEKICQEARDKERSAENLNTPLSLDQGIGKNLYETLPWLAPDPSSDNDVHGEFNYPLGGRAVTNPMLALDSGTATAEHGTSEDRRETQEISANEAGTTSSNNNALESQQANEQRAQESVPAGAEPPHHGNQINSCSVHLVDIKKEKPFFNSGIEWEAQGRTDCNQPPDPIVIQSEESSESSDEENPPQASISALKRGPGAADLRETSTSEKGKKRKRPRNHKKESVDFSSEILPVTCGEKRGLLIKRKLKRGATVKCIRTEDGNWFSPKEFEIEGGYQKSSNWKTSLRCGGETLKCLMENLHLPTPPPGTCGMKKKLDSSDKCKICLDEGKLFKCISCFDVFHWDCHLPPVEPGRTRWRCTFCALEKPSRTQQCYSESEVLVRQMGPEEKLKCEHSLLKVYCRLEGIVLRAIPHENYVEKASQCLEKLKTLDEIKKTLTERRYPQVEGFVRDMDRIFQGPSCNDSDGIEEEFKKNFKEVFAIQKRN